MEGGRQKLSTEKREIFLAIEQASHELNTIGHDIWRYSEPAGEEEKSRDRITSFLKKKGFKIWPRFKDFSNAFRAEFGEGEFAGKPHPNVAFLCEYSADPESGHSRGHNLNTVVCLGGAMGLQRAFRFSKTPLGKITVIGCTSNPEKTAKMQMFEQGFFRGVDFLLTAYPAPYTCLQPRFMASKKIRATFTGRAGQDLKEWEEANPVNAVVMAYQSVGALRQHLLSGWQLKGVIPRGGSDPCTIPDRATTEYQMKAPSERGLHVLYEKIHQCIEGSAIASGCRFEEEIIGQTFMSNINCPTFEELYTANAKANGFTFNNLEKRPQDEDEISSITHGIATMKIFYYAGTSFMLEGDEFNRFCGSPEAEFMSTLQCKSMAMTGYDLLTKKDIVAIVYTDHEKMLAKNMQEKHEPI